MQKRFLIYNSIGGMNMEKKQIRKKIYSMIFPIILENVLQLAVGIISMGMIGRISVTAVSAQGVSSLLVGIIWSLFKGISVAATVLIAKAYGAKDNEKLKKVGQQTLLSLWILSVVLQQLVFWKAETLLLVFNPKASILNDAVKYLKILSFGFPFSATMLCVTGILQGKGNAKTPMLIALIMNITNICLSYTFIFGHFGFQPMGLVGAAMALVLSQGVGAGCGLFVLFAREGVLQRTFNRSFFKLDFSELKVIFRIGIPTGLESIFWQLSSIVLSRVILSFGEVAFAAHQLGLQAEAISEMPALGFGVAATAFTGQSLGAMNKKLGKEYIWEIGKGAMLVISIGTTILIFFPHVAMRLLTDNQEVIKLGAIYLRLMGLVQIPQNLQRVFTGALKGAGYTRIPMLIAGIGLWGIRIPFALLLTKYFNLSIIAIWVVICVDQTFRFILSYILYKRKGIFKEDETTTLLENKVIL